MFWQSKFKMSERIISFSDSQLEAQLVEALKTCSDKEYAKTYMEKLSKSVPAETIRTEPKEKQS